MYIVVAYDVNTLTGAGRRRLRKIAKVCEGFGQRVQYSVFECTVTDAQFERLRHKLEDTIDGNEDSLRIYFLHGDRTDCTISIGRDGYVDYEDVLLA